MNNKVFSLDLSSLNAGIATLLQKGKIDNEAAMKGVAMIGESATRDRTPIDEGTLTGDVRGSVQRDGGTIGAVISIPENAPSKDYAIPMHEGVYNLGPLSLSKQAKVGKMVGRKFIERGIDDSKKEMLDEIIKHKRL